MTLPAICVTAALMAAPPAADARDAALQLARTGQHEEALRTLCALASRDPHDVDARFWVGQLLLWTGDAAGAEQAFRDILGAVPEHVDALVGLGTALDRQGRTGEALAMLERAESLDPGRADTLSALGRTHRHAGRGSRAVAYYRRAAGLAPADADIREGLETARRQHAHRLDTTVAYEQFDQALPPTRAGVLDLSVRVTDRVRVELRQQVQSKFGIGETRTGAGLEWRTSARVRVRAAAAFAPGADVLPRRETVFEVERGGPHADVTAGVRVLQFPSATVLVAAPAVSVPLGDRAVATLRYFLARTAFVQTGRAVRHHSAGVSLRTRAARRLWLTGGYARGHESVEALSIDRIGRFSADTFGAGVRIDPPGLSLVSAGLEYERGSARSLWRITTGVAQRF